MTVSILTKDGKEKSKLDLSAEIFDSEVNDHLLYEAVKIYLANQRQGTKKAKGRSEVSGGGAKPWRQKGTGRARAGSNTSPIWVRGGKAFGPSPSSYYSKLPKKLKRKAVISALTVKAREKAIKIIDSVAPGSPKTKEIQKVLDGLEVAGKKNLIVVKEYSENLTLASRNIPWLKVMRASDLNAYAILNAAFMIITEDALEEINKRYKEVKNEG
ncbi:MAG: 50S ribosomal protein L4 [Fibrobacterota bacterium]